MENFRLSDKIENWPLGGNKRGLCTFAHERNKKGQRILKTTTGKPKASRYAPYTCLADLDGKTVIVQATEYGHISITDSALKYSVGTIHENDPNYREIFQTIQSICE